MTFDGDPNHPVRGIIDPISVVKVRQESRERIVLVGDRA